MSRFTDAATDRMAYPVVACRPAFLPGRRPGWRFGLMATLILLGALLLPLGVLIGWNAALLTACGG